MRRSTIQMVVAGVAVAIAGLIGWRTSISSKPSDLVKLNLGEPYEQVRQSSRAMLPPSEPGISFAAVLSRPARFRFSEPSYGFETPPAKFMMVNYDRTSGKIESVVLSPQIEALPLDDAMAILGDMQRRLRHGGWTPFRNRELRPIEDTPETRQAIRGCSDPTSRWNAGGRYQVSLDIRCFRTQAKPDDETFLITLNLGSPVFDDRTDGD